MGPRGGPIPPNSHGGAWSNHGTGPGLVKDRGLVKSWSGAWSSHGTGPGLVRDQGLVQSKNGAGSSHGTAGGHYLFESMRFLSQEGLILKRPFVSNGIFCLNGVFV